jgi:hypothetical protein
MMIKYCYVATEKLLKFKFVPRKDEDDELDDEDMPLNVAVFDEDNEDGIPTIYHFADYEDFNTFIVMLEEEGLDYEVVDDDGNFIEFDDEYYEDNHD